MTDTTLKLLILGAHPDDAEFHAGGLASLYREKGHMVRAISVTDGGAGHHETPRPQLVQLRRAEAAASGNVIGAEYLTWDFPDGGLTPTLEVRERIIREIRAFAPDLVLTHRVNDYHPDHRAVGQAVQDASYMVTVPSVCSDTPALRKDPVVAFMVDLFTKPCPLEPHAILDATDRIDTVVSMLACHRSQVFEWLPYNQRVLDRVPADETEKIAWLRDWYLQLVRPRLARFREPLIAAYGQEQADLAKLIEVYEISEYAAQPDEELKRALFPFGSHPLKDSQLEEKNRKM